MVSLSALGLPVLRYTCIRVGGAFTCCILCVDIHICSAIDIPIQPSTHPILLAAPPEGLQFPLSPVSLFFFCATPSPPPPGLAQGTARMESMWLRTRCGRCPVG